MGLKANGAAGVGHDLGHLNLDSTGQPISVRAQGPPDLCELGPDYDVADPVYPD